MALNQFLTATLTGDTLEVSGKTESGSVSGLEEITVAVGKIGDDGELPADGDNLLHDTLGPRRIESPWNARFPGVSSSYGKGDLVILIGVARGDFPGGPVEIWYERAEIK